MRQQIWYWLMALLALKLFLCWVQNPTFALNPDEQSNYQIALNFTNGHGYSLFDAVHQRYILSAYHGSFTVFLYRLLIDWSISPADWALVVMVLSAFLGTVSVPFCYRLSLLLSGSSRWALGSAVVYALYPSCLYFIGSLFAYENITMPLLVIVVYRLVVHLNRQIHWAEMVLLAAIITLSCLLRGQMLLVYALIVAGYIGLLRKSTLFNGMAFGLMVLLMVAVAHVPILRKNHGMFGAYLLSTQPGFELLQGFHPAARGSWMGNWRSSESPLYQYAHVYIPNIDQLNEWQESQARLKLALKWMKEHPLGVVMLLMRKLAIYWMPHNYEVLPGARVFHPVTALVHLLCIGFIAFYCFGARVDYRLALLVLVPILGSILLSLIFFVGYRWRYYAEPFMVVLAMDAMKRVYSRLRS
jgi:hypothetical protein